ncbi:MAG: prepilin-type N-terminal cleavage/methylation domain-containing protein [Candidatus Omnitrophica bacterium]|nr:prepilin-type N-terminal cleavage/methylation domain-containing protein [Candidatus Omnitrophota bacterium]
MRIRFVKSGFGFTLVEILVVLAVMGILAALLMPSVSLVRCKAKMVKCMSNIRQLGIACVMYEQDYDALPGTLSRLDPYLKSHYANSLHPLPKHLFAIKLAHAQYEPLSPYYDNNQGVLQCPAATPGEISYGINAKLKGKKIASFKSANMILLADSNNRTEIEMIDHLGFRHCKEKRANIITPDLTEGSYIREDIQQGWFDLDHETIGEFDIMNVGQIEQAILGWIAASGETDIFESIEIVTTSEAPENPYMTLHTIEIQFKPGRGVWAHTDSDGDGWDNLTEIIGNNGINPSDPYDLYSTPDYPDGIPRPPDDPDRESGDHDEPPPE